MNVYPVGVDVEVSIPLVNHAGDAVVPTGLTYSVYDQEGVILQGAQIVPVTDGMTVAVFTVAAAVNMIGDLVEARSVELEVTTSSTSFTIPHVYLVSKPQRLVTMQNSFQTLPQAMAEASQMPNLVAWEAATDNDRTVALIEAFIRLTRLGYRIRRPEDIDLQNYLVAFDELNIIEPRFWPLINKELWLSTRYTDQFRAAMRKAQIAEANEILRGDRINEKRRSGIMSETIGESSMMFRVGKPLDLGLSAAALNYVTGFVQTRMTLTRS